MTALPCKQRPRFPTTVTCRPALQLARSRPPRPGATTRRAGRAPPTPRRLRQARGRARHAGKAPLGSSPRCASCPAGTFRPGPQQLRPGRPGQRPRGCLPCPHGTHAPARQCGVPPVPCGLRRRPAEGGSRYPGAHLETLFRGKLARWTRSCGKLVCASWPFRRSRASGSARQRWLLRSSSTTSLSAAQRGQAGKLPSESWMGIPVGFCDATASQDVAVAYRAWGARAPVIKGAVGRPGRPATAGARRHTRSPPARPNTEREPGAQQAGEDAGNCSERDSMGIMMESLDAPSWRGRRQLRWRRRGAS
jgi:hypothetical protein